MKLYFVIKKLIRCNYNLRKELKRQKQDKQYILTKLNDQRYANQQMKKYIGSQRCYD